MSYSTVQILVFIVLSINSVGGVYILLKFLFDSIHFRQRQPRTKLGGEFIVLRNISLFSMISFILSQGIYMMCQLFFPLNLTLGWFAWLLRMFTVFSFLIFQFWRLYTTFKDTTHALSRPTIAILITLIITASVLALFCGADIIAADQVLLKINIALAICVTVIPIQCTVLFSRKLFKLVLQLRESVSRTVDASQSTRTQSLQSVSSVSSVASSSMSLSGLFLYSDFGTLSKRQVSLLDTISKQTVCTSFQTLFFVFSMPMFIFISYFYNFDQDGNINSQSGTIVFVCIYLILSIVGNIGMPLMIWFSFIFAKDKYFLFCNSCHRCCLKGFKYRAVRAQIKQDSHYVQLEDDEAL